MTDERALDTTAPQVGPVQLNGGGGGWPEGAEHEDATIADPTVTFAEFVADRDENTADPLIAAEEGTLLPAGGLAILAAKVHDGKTTLGVVELVLHACAGVEFLRLTFPRALNILVIENEGPREAFRQKLEARLSTWEHDGAPRIWNSPAEWGQVRVSDPATPRSPPGRRRAAQDRPRRLRLAHAVRGARQRHTGGDTRVRRLALRARARP